MSPARKAAKGSKGSSKRSAAKKTAAKKTARKPPASKKSVARKLPRKKKVTAKKKTAKKKTAARKTPAKKTVKKAPAKKTTAKKTKTTAKKTTAKAPVAKAIAAAGGDAPTPTAKPAPKKMVIRKPLPKAPPTRKPRPAKLDKETLGKIRAQLRQERADLRKQQEELEEDSFEGSQSELTGEVGLDEDFADAGTATFDRERDLSIRNNIRDLIQQIDKALVRIDEGTYGTCERCGRPIDAARLKALPHASLCLDCKRRDERVR